MDKVIANMVRVAPFFDSRCRINFHNDHPIYWSCKSVRVLFQPGFQGQRYLEIVDAIDGYEASNGEAAVLPEGSHAHQPRDRVQQQAVLATHRDAASYQLLD